jgi:glycosyltransferase involved in cell wall biosynthesis
MRIARECPDHRFILTLVRCNGMEEFVDTLIEENRSLGDPVDLRVNVPHEEMATLMQEAGIYLHTHSPGSRFGMPVSIGEAMATGAYVIGRRCTGSEAYIGDAGDLYDDEDQAAHLVRMTTGWSEEQWRRAEVRAIDRAYGHFLDSEVLRPILEDWIRLAAESASSTSLRIPA